MDNKPLMDFLDSLATVRQLQDIDKNIGNSLKEITAQLEDLKRQNLEQKLLLESYARIMQEQTALVAGLNRLLNDKMSSVSDALELFNERMDEMVSKKPEPVPEPEPVAEPIVVKEPEPVKESEPAVEPKVTEEPEPAKEPEPVRKPEPLIEPEQKHQTIADSIKVEESIAEQLSKKVERTTIANSLNSTPIVSIQSAITIADRFRFQRELFSGNGALMSATIDDLNLLSTFAEAEAYINEHFQWNPDNQAVTDFMSIVSRKFV